MGDSRTEKVAWAFWIALFAAIYGVAVLPRLTEWMETDNGLAWGAALIGSLVVSWFVYALFLMIVSRGLALLLAFGPPAGIVVLGGFAAHEVGGAPGGLIAIASLPAAIYVGVKWFNSETCKWMLPRLQELLPFNED